MLCGLVLACAGGSGERGAAPGGENTADATRRSWAGESPAPEFPEGLDWLNTPAPLRLADLRGRVVLLDFWTLGCINCQHIIPDLQRLEAEFGDALVVIGVHSGKYETEQDAESIREAIRRHGLEHPVVNDPDFVFWRTFGARAWPTLILIDPAGNLVGGHAGEGIYELFEPIVSSLVAEFEGRGLIARGSAVTVLGERAPATVLSYPGKAVGALNGELYVADSGHNRILAVGPGSRVRTLGSGREGFRDGPAAEAEFRQPQGLALSPDQATLYVADTRNHAVRAIDLASGRVTTVAGTGRQLQRLPRQGAIAAETDLASPWDVLVHGETLFVSMAGVHQIWALDLPTGTIAVFAGTSREGIDDGDRLRMATLAQPSGLATDGRSLYWVDPESSSVRRVALGGQGQVETIVGTGLFDYGYADGAASTAMLQHPQGIVYGDGLLYIADTYNHRVRVVDPAGGRVSTLAGGERGWADGAGSSVRFDEPAGVGLAADGRLVVADQNNHLLRLVDRRSGVVETVLLADPGVAAGPGEPGRVYEVVVPAQAVAPGVGQIAFAISSPPGHKLNSLAPSELRIATSNAAVVEPGETTLRWSSDEGSVSFSIPVRLAAGRADLLVSGVVYYCRAGEEALCFIQQVAVSVAVEVAPGAGRSEIGVAFELPASPG